MTVVLLDAANQDLEAAFEYFENVRKGLGGTFMTEFGRGIDRILAHPGAWHPLDDEYRRYRLRKFPYGVVYRVDHAKPEIVVAAIEQLNRRPDDWRRRAR